MISAGLAAGVITVLVFYFKGGSWSYRSKKINKPATHKRPSAPTLEAMAKVRIQKNALFTSSGTRVPPALNTASLFKDHPLPYDSLTCSSPTPISPVPPPSPSPLDGLVDVNPSIHEDDTLLNDCNVNRGVGVSNSMSNGVKNGMTRVTNASPENRPTFPRKFPDLSDLQRSYDSHDHQQYQQRERAATMAANLVEQGQGQGQGQHTTPKQKKDRRYTTLF